MINNKVYIITFFSLLTMLVGCKAQQGTKVSSNKAFFSLDNNFITIYSPEVKDTVKIVLLSDTHLSMKDDREKPYEQYSNRMSGAYNITRHYKTGKETNPANALVETVKIAKDENADLLALIGDIISYPSERSIEWVDSILDSSKLRYIYTAGNHDWHYEGMEGSLQELRQTWINKRLYPLYQGQNPLFYSVDIKGIRVIIIDNSTYEISPDQLSFFHEQVKTGMPLILMMHIPLYMPERPVNYGCAHPDWNKKHDNLYELERRESWPKEGHTRVTKQFREDVLNDPNLLAVFSGHIHEQTLDVVNGRPFFVVKENASGNYFYIKIVPINK